MGYLIQGWNKFDFLLTPSELREVLQHYHMVIDNAHVPLEYEESFVDEYIDTFEKLYDLLITGKQLIWSRDNSLLIHRGITSDLSRCKYGRIHEFQGKKYKNAQFDEPVVHLSPFSLRVYKNSNNRLCSSTSYSYMQNPEAVMGIQMSYPKKIQYSTDGRYEPLKDTCELSGYDDYLSIRKMIIKTTKPLYVLADNEQTNTNIHVSESAKRDLKKHFYIQNNRFSIR